jgi:hypothetical protein
VGSVPTCPHPNLDRILDSSEEEEEGEKMFTVKIMKQDAFKFADGPTGKDGTTATCLKQCTKLIEASEVEIHTLRYQELYGVSGITNDGRKFYYYIANPDRPFPEDIAKEDSGTGEPIFGYAAYIENSAGATTEVIKF